MADGKEIHLFTTHIAARVHNVVLIGGNQAQFKLAKKATYSRKLFGFFFANFNRKHQWRLVVEIKTDEGVSDLRAHPVRGNHIDARDLVQIIAAGFPAFGILGFTVPSKITHIVQGDDVA